MPLPTYSVVELRAVILCLGYGWGLCVKEKRGEWMVGVVPFLTSFQNRKYLLLGVHVHQQISNTVAVAELVVIPEEMEGGKSRKRYRESTRERY